MRHLNKEIWPHQITYNVDSISIDDWCQNTLGKMCKDWYSYQVDRNIIRYAFKKEEDMMLFKLRWSKNGN